MIMLWSHFAEEAGFSAATGDVPAVAVSGGEGFFGQAYQREGEAARVGLPAAHTATEDDQPRGAVLFQDRS